MSLTPQVRAFLEEPRFAVMATLMPDGRIQQTVIWYDLRDDMIMINTAAGRVKDRNLRRDPRVSFCIEDGYSFVTLQGRAVEIIDDQEIARADFVSLARRYHPDYTDAQIDENYPNFRKEHRETILIAIDHVLAKAV